MQYLQAASVQSPELDVALPPTPPRLNPCSHLALSGQLALLWASQS